jgi:hypothetical protein
MRVLAADATVHRLAAQGFQDQQVERAREEFRGFWRFPSSTRWEDTM